MLLCTVLLVFSAGVMSPLWAGRLSPGDKVRIEVLGRSDLSGEFEIRASGGLVLPLIGKIDAAGQTIEALEARLVDALTKVERSPVVTVMSAILRPVYVMGYVRTATSVPYRHGLTAIQAIASAGGYGVGSPASSESQLEAIRVREALETLLVRRDALLVQRARLLAERDGLEDLSIDALLEERTKIPAVAALARTEKKLLDSRFEQLKSQLASQERRAGIHKEEIAALEKQLASLEKEQAIAVSEHNITSGLVKQNLTSRQRAAESERNVLRVNSEIAASTAFRARAQAALAQAEQEQQDIVARRRQQVLAALSTNSEDLLEIEQRLESARQQVAIASTGMLDPAARARFALPEALVLIRNGERSRIEELSELEPGDTVEVPYPATD